MLVAGDPTGPVNKGEIQKAALGMEIEILNEHGGRVRKGEQGELVCASVFPSMPVRFLNDPDDEKYQKRTSINSRGSGIKETLLNGRYQMESSFTAVQMQP